MRDVNAIQQRNIQLRNLRRDSVRAFGPERQGDAFHFPAFNTTCGKSITAGPGLDLGFTVSV